jgi:ABC-type antimicrobial peptide transport system permease subunit
MSNPSVQVVPSLAHTPSHDHGGHVVQLYTDDGFLIDVLSRFIGGALAVGDAAVVVATAARTESSLRDGCLAERWTQVRWRRKDVILCWTQARPYLDSW